MGVQADACAEAVGLGMEGSRAVTEDLFAADGEAMLAISLRVGCELAHIKALTTRLTGSWAPGIDVVRSCWLWTVPSIRLFSLYSTVQLQRTLLLGLQPIVDS